MIKSITTLGLLLVSFLTFAQTEANNTTMIQNGSNTISPSHAQEDSTTSEEKYSINNQESETLTYSDDMISFNYYKSLSLIVPELGEGIEQIMVMSSEENGFLIQEYLTLDPTLFMPLLLRQLTEEKINQGYRIFQKKIKMKLKNGQKLEGIRATLTYKKEKAVYTIASYGKGDKGIVLLTKLMKNSSEEDKKSIDLFLETLVIKEF